MKWVERLKAKWNVNTFQVVIILIVFACTGFTVMFLKEPILDLLVDEEDRSWVFTVLYYLLILPIYNVVLLIYGFIFGQFKFFWNFEKRMFKRILGRK
ncbi:MAG: DUF6787 family protein [Fulvivirga sp.]|nr:DUF6787 family protein [Fulvivirga sp.]